MISACFCLKIRYNFLLWCLSNSVSNFLSQAQEIDLSWQYHESVSYFLPISLNGAAIPTIKATILKLFLETSYYNVKNLRKDNQATQYQVTHLQNHLSDNFINAPIENKILKIKTSGMNQSL